MSRKKRPRRTSPADDESIFGDQRPLKNPAALMAYRLAVLGLVPGLGAITGPVAMILGFVGRRRFKADPTIAGRSQSDAAMLLGAATAACHLGGLYCLYSAW